MSDIVIRNIQIPKDNGILVLFVDKNKKVGVFENRKFARPTDAIELPQHGDLGDTSELYVDILADLQTSKIQTLQDVIKIINKVFEESPTILEASK